MLIGEPALTPSNEGIVNWRPVVVKAYGLHSKNDSEMSEAITITVSRSFAVPCEIIWGTGSQAC